MSADKSRGRVAAGRMSANRDGSTVGNDLALFYGGEVVSDPYRVLARIRDASPCRVGDSAVVVVARQDDCAAVLRDPGASVDRAHASMPTNLLDTHWLDQSAVAPGSTLQGSFLFLDAPDHTRLRRLVASAFTPRAVNKLEPGVAAFVDGVFDRAAESGSLDVVADLAHPLPVAVICDLLGVPAADATDFQQWSAVITRAIDPVSSAVVDPARALAELAAAEAELQGYLEDLVEHRRADPGDDLLSDLIAVENNGDTLSHSELVSTAALLLIAGHETTVNLIANGVLALVRHPVVAESLRNDPSLGPAVVEETLRFDPPIQTAARIAREPITVGDLEIQRGDIIGLLLAAANRDPSVHHDPDTFDPGRSGRHMAFGLGNHFCLGAPLARLEARIALTRFAERVVNPRLLDDPPPYRPHISLRGPASMKLAFDQITIGRRSPTSAEVAPVIVSPFRWDSAGPCPVASGAASSLMPFDDTQNDGYETARDA